VREPAKSCNSRVNTCTCESGKPATCCKGAGFPRGGCRFRFLTHGLPVKNPTCAVISGHTVCLLLSSFSSLSENGLLIHLSLPLFACSLRLSLSVGSFWLALEMVSLTLALRICPLLPLCMSSHFPQCAELGATTISLVHGKCYVISLSHMGLVVTRGSLHAGRSLLQLSPTHGVGCDLELSFCVGGYFCGAWGRIVVSGTHSLRCQWLMTWLSASFLCVAYKSE
jgi:hypothetical protein